jgi:hypothetical protein
VMFYIKIILFQERIFIWVNADTVSEIKSWYDLA